MDQFFADAQITEKKAFINPICHSYKRFLYVIHIVSKWYCSLKSENLYSLYMEPHEYIQLTTTENETQVFAVLFYNEHTHRDRDRKM